MKDDIFGRSKLMLCLYKGSYSCRSWVRTGRSEGEVLKSGCENNLIF